MVSGVFGGSVGKDMALGLLVVLVGRQNLWLLVIWTVMSGNVAVVLCWVI